VFGEDGTGVESVMIGGRWVMRDRKLLTVDVEALRRKAEEALGEKLHPYVGRFCQALSAG
jgi:hypothetical protein